jgi:hypothetical protein
LDIRINLTRFEVGREAAIPISCKVSGANEIVSPLFDESVVTRFGEEAEVV